MTRRIALLLALATLAAPGCVTVNNYGAPAASATPAAVGQAITGRVVGAPGMVAAGGGNVIVDNAGNILAPQAGVVGNNGGSVVGHNGGALVAPGYGLRAEAEVPIAGAIVELADALGRRIPGVGPATTGPDGRYALPGVPDGQAFVVQSHVNTAAGKPARLFSLARAAAGAEAELSVASTVVTTGVLAGPAADLTRFASAPFGQAVAAARTALAAGPTPDVASREAVMGAVGALLRQVPALRDAMDLVRRDMGMPPAAVAAAAPTAAPASASPSAPASPTAAPSDQPDFFASLPFVALTATAREGAYRLAAAPFTHPGGPFATILLRIGSPAGREIGGLVVDVYPADAAGRPTGSPLTRRAVRPAEVRVDRGDDLPSALDFPGAEAAAGPYVYVFSAVTGELGLRTTLFGSEGAGGALVSTDALVDGATWTELRPGGTMFVDVD